MYRIYDPSHILAHIGLEISVKNNLIYAQAGQSAHEWVTGLWASVLRDASRETSPTFRTTYGSRLPVEAFRSALSTEAARRGLRMLLFAQPTYRELTVDVFRPAALSKALGPEESFLEAGSVPTRRTTRLSFHKVRRITPSGVLSIL